MGRNMFGPDRGEWAGSDWRGWWGDKPPYHAPVFVLTHYEREPVEMAGGTTFHFVTGGFDTAYAAAVEAAGDEEILIAGGASTIERPSRPACSTRSCSTCRRCCSAPANASSTA